MRFCALMAMCDTFMCPLSAGKTALKLSQTLFSLEVRSSYRPDQW